nr:hypothetical protein Iba_chr01cCG14230 [Ipomoea batatas]GMC54233.1 hypothetical protein Iba_chr01dCG14220 [Ipomoea batatas]
MLSSLSMATAETARTLKTASAWLKKLKGYDNNRFSTFSSQTLEAIGRQFERRVPNFARRFTHFGIFFPIAAWRSINSLTWFGFRRVVPMNIDFLNLNPGQCPGSTSNTPLVG